MSDIVRLLMILIGTLFVALGVIGIFVPLLPSTPFFLLAAFFYARSSERFYRWLLTNRWFGESLRNYREGRGLPLREKVLTILLLWITIGTTVGFAVSQWWVRLLLLLIAIGVTAHLVTIKTYQVDAHP